MLTTQSTTPIDYDGLINDREFEGTLSSRELPLSVSLIQTNELIVIAKEIIRLIEDEISDKK